MKQILGYIRRADQDFSMIQSGDKISVGVSGGKDSLLLLTALAQYRKFSPNPFELSAMTVTMGLGAFDLSGIHALCDKLEVPYIIKQTRIGSVVFEDRHEKNPCALCAKMRRGALTATCALHGINKIALGHHRDDALETLLLSMFYEGRMHTFQPVTHLDRSGITQIRPMVYLSEQQISRAATRLELPVVKSPCPIDGTTRREDMKHILDDICLKIPDARKQMLSALMNPAQFPLWQRGSVPQASATQVDLTDNRTE